MIPGKRVVPALFVSLALVGAAGAFQPQPAPAAPAVAPSQPAAQAPGAPKADMRRFGVADPVPKPAGAIRLATYNLENMFDDRDDPALSGDKNEDKDMTKPEAQRKALALAIRRIDADILCVEEVESKEALLWFRDGFLKDMGYTNVVSIDAGDDRGIEQAVLSRFPVSEEKNWVHRPLGGEHPDKAGRNANEFAGKPITFHRSPLRVTVQVPGFVENPAAGGTPVPPVAPPSPPQVYLLTLFVVHQKSGKDWEYWREKEAAQTVELAREIQEENPDRNIAILGDFNAAPGAPCMKIYMDAGLLDAFANAKPKDPAAITHESGKALDHILMNPALVHDFIPRTHFVLGTPARPADADWTRTLPPEGYGSDHYPVVVDLTPSDR